MATEVGVGYVSIVPSAKGFGRDLAKQIGPDMPAVGDDMGKKVGESAGDRLEDEGRRGGRRFGNGFTDFAKKAMLVGLAGVAIGAAVAARTTVNFMKDATTAASDLGESVNAVRVTFGPAADGILNLGKKAAQAVGLSNTEFNSLAVQFSNFAQTIAGPSGDVAGIMEELTGRAADFASVMNLDVSEAARLFQSGLAGESEPLRAYGLDLSAAAVEAYALANGIVKAEVDTTKLGAAQAKLASAQADLLEKQRSGTATAEELQVATAKVATAEKAVSDALEGKAPKMTEADKVMARYQMLMEQTNKTAGDFANTSGSMANQQRILASEFTNLKAKVGEAIIPVVEQFLPKLVEGVRWVSAKITENMPQIQATLTAFADKIIAQFPVVVSWLQGVAATVAAKWPAIVQAFYDAREFAGQVAERIGELWDKFRELPPEVKAFVASAVALKLLGLDGIFRAAAGAVVGMIGPMLGLNAAMLANPATWVAAAIALLVAALVGVGIALRHFYAENETFRRNWDAAWEDVRVAVEDFLVVWNEDLWPAIKHVLPVIAAYASYYLGSVARFVALATGWIDKLVAAIEALRDAWNWIKGSAGQWTGGRLPGNSTGAGGGGAGSFATGGPVGGYGNGDTVPAMLTPGEYVLNRRMVSQAGGVKQLEGWRAGLAGPGGIEVGSIVINNPVAEPASQSLPKAVRKLAYVGVGA